MLQQATAASEQWAGDTRQYEMDVSLKRMAKVCEGVLQILSPAVGVLQRIHRAVWKDLMSLFNCWNWFTQQTLGCQQHMWFLF